MSIRRMQSVSKNSIVGATLLAGVFLLETHSAPGQTSNLVFKGTPEHKVESYEHDDFRYQLDSAKAAASEVLIVATKNGCVWRSRGDRRVNAVISGGYVIFETIPPSASYLKVARGIEGQFTASTELGHVFLEHVSQRLNTITYRGRSVEMNRPERCVSR